MDGLLDIRGVKNMARFISTCFLVVHVAMFVIFWRCGVIPMAFFNVGSVIFYVLTFALIQKEMLGFYTDLMYLEVVAHMTCAILLTGWNSDFQVTLVGMSAVVYFAEYLERYLGMRQTHALPLCIVGAVAYLSSCVACALRPAPYTMPDTVSLLLRLSLGAVFFAVSTLVLQVFVREATKSEKALANRLMHDKLTGLPNRYFVADYMKRLSNSGNIGKCWVALADIDDFKKVNDTYGHNCGDIVTITMGVATYEQGRTTSEWINTADERLYEGKRAGKNRVVAG